jgi:hypothetical protein
MSGDGGSGTGGNDNASANNAGSDSTGGNNKSTHDSTQDDANASGGANNDAGGDSKGTQDNSSTTETVSKADYEALFKRMQAADQRASKLEKAQQEAADKDLSEAEKAKKDAAESKARADAAEAKLRDEKVFNAFLSRTDIAWHDVNDAFTMLKSNYMDGVDVDKDGKVTGIEPAVKKLAKEKAYLVKVAGDSSGGTGAAHNGQRKGDQNDTGREARASRFPAAYGPR